MRLQEFIHKLEEGEGVWAMRIVVAVLALVTLGVWYNLNEFQNFRTADAMEAAQLARNLARGEGYTTQCVRPLALHLVEQKQGVSARLSKQPHPDLATPPVYPTVLAALMKVLPFRYDITPRFWRYQPELIIAIFNQCLFILTVWLTYRLARRLFDLPVALVVAAVLLTSDIYWKFSVSGLSTCLLILIFCLVLWTLFALESASRAPAVVATPTPAPASTPTPPASPEGAVAGASAPATSEAAQVVPAMSNLEPDSNEPGPGPMPWLAPQDVLAAPAPAGRVALLALVLGALIGVGMLTRYSFGWLLLPAVGSAMVWLRGRRALVAGLAVLAFLLVVSPWIYRNYSLSGQLFGIQGYAPYQDTVPFPETRLERSLNPDLSTVEARDIVRKLFGNVGDIVQNELPRLGGGSWIAAFFLVGLFLRFRAPGLGRLRLFVLLSVVLMILVQGVGRTHLSYDVLTVNSENLLVLLLPGVALFGTALFFVLLDHMNLAILELRLFMVVLFVGVAAAPLVITLLPPRVYPIIYPPYLPPWIQESARFLQRNELIMSDMPWAVAWYGDRTCVWNTLDSGKSFYTVNDEQKAVSALYLSPLSTDAKFLTQVLQGQDYEWSRFAVEVLTRTNLPAAFPLKHARKKYSPDQLFLCDRPRWQEPRR
jgi:hypothetical protein